MAMVMALASLYSSTEGEWHLVDAQQMIVY